MIIDLKHTRLNLNQMKVVFHILADIAHACESIQDFQNVIEAVCVVQVSVQELAQICDYCQKIIIVQEERLPEGWDLIDDKKWCGDCRYNTSAEQEGKGE